MKFCEEKDVKRHFTIWKTPLQNGVVERLNKTIVERVRYMRLNVGDAGASKLVFSFLF